MNKKNNNADTTFTATFTLTQKGSGAPVVSVLKFEPLIEDASEAPTAYEIMAHLVQEYLYCTGIIDETGELINPDEFHANSKLSVSKLGQGKLN